MYTINEARGKDEQENDSPLRRRLLGKTSSTDVNSK
jgi:hypothetical protein